MSTGYDPFSERRLSHPINNKDLFVHFVKGVVGAGILSMPGAFKNGGLIFSVVATFVICALCAYGIQILIQTAHFIYRRSRVPSLTYAEVAEHSVLLYSDGNNIRGSLIFKYVVFFLLGLNQYFVSVVYLVFIAKNNKQLSLYYWGFDQAIQIHILILVPLITLLISIRYLKLLAIVSTVANIIIGTGIILSLYFIFRRSPAPSEEIHYVADFTTWPLLFGVVLFAIEPIGVVMQLENTMADPTFYVGCPFSVLTISMVLITFLQVIMGFFGYLNFGEEVQPTLTLSMPIEEKLGQAVRIMLTLSITMSYPLQFFVFAAMVWATILHKKPDLNKNFEYLVRFICMLATVIIACAIPELDPLFSLSGAICMSTLGIMFPSIIELLALWNDPGMGKYNWRLHKNIFLIFCGVILLISGTLIGVNEIIKVNK